MTIKFKLFAAAILTFLSGGVEAQDTVRVAPRTLARINHLPWPHIGSPPPKGGSPAEADEWRNEAATFGQAFEAIRGSWTGDEVISPDDLRARVRQYEDLIKTVSGSSGYGNILLADCLRRLSLTLAAEYALGHPADNEAVGEVLRSGRVSLLDSEAVQGMLSEELRLGPPLGGWRLAEDRQQLDLVFRNQGTTYLKEVGRVFLATSSTSSLTNRRDVCALLIRLIDTEIMERVHLSGLVEFRRLGGRLEDLNANDARTFLRVMEHDRRKFQFSPAGINMLRGEHLLYLMEAFDPHGKSISAFTKLALE